MVASAIRNIFLSVNSPIDAPLVVASAIRNIFLSVNSPIDLLASNLHVVFAIYIYFL